MVDADDTWDNVNLKPFCHTHPGVPLESATHSTEWGNSFKVTGCVWCIIFSSSEYF